jgi:hypothetical protein
MPDRSPDRTQPGAWVPPPADATRDIKLPPLPGRPAPAVPPGWSGYVPAGEQPPASEPAAPPEAERPDTRFDLPTDRLPGPQDRARSSTLQFSPPPPVQLLKVSVVPRRRSRWLWAVLIVLPLLVIAGAGIWLFVLLNGG